MSTVKPGCDDGTMTDDNGVKIFMEQLTIAMKKLGRPGATAASIRKHLEDAGFVDIKVFDFKQPLAPWPKNKVLKQVGALALLATPEGYHAYGMVAFRKALGMTFEEADRVCNESVKAAYNKNEHIYSY